MMYNTIPSERCNKNENHIMNMSGRSHDVIGTTCINQFSYRFDNSTVDWCISRIHLSSNLEFGKKKKGPTRLFQVCGHGQESDEIVQLPWRVKSGGLSPMTWTSSNVGWNLNWKHTTTASMKPFNTITTWSSVSTPCPGMQQVTSSNWSLIWLRNLYKSRYCCCTCKHLCRELSSNLLTNQLQTEFCMTL